MYQRWLVPLPVCRSAEVLSTGGDVMRGHGFRVTVAVSAAALAAATLITGTPALAVRAAPGPASTAGRLEPVAPSHRVMLITGDIVTVSALPGGPRAVSVIRAHPGGLGGVFQTFTAGGDLYVVPQSAVPYLGTVLSRGLFDVTRLANQEHGSMSLAVALRLRGPAGAASVPGITLVHRSGLAATGTLTAASAREFGAVLARGDDPPEPPDGLKALARQDGWRGRGPALRGPLAGVASIAPATADHLEAVTAGAAPSRAATYTLTLHGVNVAGQPDSGDVVLVYNVDSLKTFDGSAVFENGTATVRVPPGHYEALCFFVTRSVAAEAMDPQFTVSGNTSVTLKARSATSRVSVTTPKPASNTVLEVGFGRRDALGQVAPYSLIAGGRMAMKVAPVASRVTVGKLYYYVYTRRFSPARAKTSYTYDLEFATTGKVPADEHYTVKASSLASVASRYPAERRDQQALDTRVGALSWESDVLSVDRTLVTPTRRTEYYTASRAVTWADLYDQVWILKARAILGQLDSSWVNYRPGEKLSATWGGQTQHPRLLQQKIFIGHTYCPACISGTTLDLLVFPYSDNAPTHRGYPDAVGAGPHLRESQSFNVYADGKEVARGTGFLQESVALPSGTKDLRIDYDTARSAPYFTLSTRAETRWTVPTTTTAALPRGWYCTEANQTDCGVLPLLSADYDLPVNLLGQLRPGRVAASVAVSHLAAAAIRVRSVRVWVSVDGGTSWKRATVTATRRGHYAVSFTVPVTAKTDGFGAIRLKATDARGGTLRQTVQHAFAVAAR
jgi:hypothetical protein